MNFGIFKKKHMAAAVALALPLTAQYEGIRTRAYLDPVGIPTICYGETENVKLGDVKSKKECDEMLTVRLGYFSSQVDLMVSREMTPAQHAAYTSLAYNIGLGAFKNSSVLRLANEGRKKESCEFIKRYVYAGGKKLNGLIKRREAEAKLCLE